MCPSLPLSARSVPTRPRLRQDVEQIGYVYASPSSVEKRMVKGFTDTSGLPHGVPCACSRTVGGPAGPQTSGGMCGLTWSREFGGPGGAGCWREPWPCWSPCGSRPSNPPSPAQPKPPPGPPTPPTPPAAPHRQPVRGAQADAVRNGRARRSAPNCGLPSCVHCVADSPTSPSQPDRFRAGGVCVTQVMMRAALRITAVRAYAPATVAVAVSLAHPAPLGHGPPDRTVAVACTR